MAYLIGRFFGGPAVRWLVSDKRFRRFERYADRTLTLPRLLLLQIAIPSEIPGYVLGCLKFSPVTYLSALAMVELPFAVGVVYLGDRFLQRDYIVLACVALAGLAVTFVAGWVIHREDASHPSAAGGAQHAHAAHQPIPVPSDLTEAAHRALS